MYVCINIHTYMRLFIHTYIHKVFWTIACAGLVLALIKYYFFEETNELYKMNIVYNYKIFKVGDFNINLLDNSFLTSKFLVIILTHEFCSLIYKPTRPASQPLFDNTFANLPVITLFHMNYLITVQL